jgi:hypothetical protein
MLAQQRGLEVRQRSFRAIHHCVGEIRIPEVRARSISKRYFRAPQIRSAERCLHQASPE